jgi:hypothetical protein
MASRPAALLETTEGPVDGEPREREHDGLARAVQTAYPTVNVCGVHYGVRYHAGERFPPSCVEGYGGVSLRSSWWRGFCRAFPESGIDITACYVWRVRQVG